MARWQRRRAALALTVAGACLTAACGFSGRSATQAGASLPTGASSGPSSPGPSSRPSSGPSSASAPASAPATPASSPQATAATTPALSPAAAAAPLAAGALQGKVVVIDPGHNGANFKHTRQISKKVEIGNGTKACDTTGTETDAGYSEAAFTLDVATRLAALLRAEGATVVLTRTDNRGVGPCITERAAIGNQAHADAAISVHGDGAPARGYGFHVIVPSGIGSNDAIVTPSRRLGVQVRDAFRSGTGEPLSTYTGTATAGLVSRSDLGGLNLSTVPKVFIECGNMRNATDARRMANSGWRQRAAAALATGITEYLSTP